MYITKTAWDVEPGDIIEFFNISHIIDTVLLKGDECWLSSMRSGLLEKVNKNKKISIVLNNDEVF